MRVAATVVKQLSQGIGETIVVDAPRVGATYLIEHDDRIERIASGPAVSWAPQPDDERQVAALLPACQSLDGSN